MNCDSPFYVLRTLASIEKVPVPCGRCPPCKLRRVNSWVFRLMQEAKRSVTAHFVTLTYDTTTVPISKNGFMTLDKQDVQKWMKRLRKLETNKLKYYLVGEYGTKNGRPHYHAIVFNVSNVEHFNFSWGLGETHIGHVTSDSVAYTMKYIDKANFNKKHGRDDRVPEFPLMSKGLGDNYLSPEMIQYHKEDLTRLYATKPSGHRIALPRYYRQRIYDKQQMSQQVDIIQEKMLLALDTQHREFLQLNYGPYYTFDDYLDSEKMGRYHAFYSQQKNRL